MGTEEQIRTYIDSQTKAKRDEMQLLHELILKASPDSRLWFHDGRNEEGKVVSNPNIGYGMYTIRYADGSTREFFRVGLSGNKTGISVYIMGLSDKTFLPQTYGEKIGKAKVTGYCIHFKKLPDIDTAVLIDAVKYGLDYRE